MNLTKQEARIERMMLRAYREQVNLVINHPQWFNRLRRDVIKIGPERELFILDKTCPSNPNLEGKRNQIANSDSNQFYCEIGKNQEELINPPQDILSSEGLELFINSYLDSNRLLSEKVADCDLSLGTCGTNPFLDPNQLEVTSGVPKYKVVPDFYDKHRCVDQIQYGTTELVNIASSKIPAILQAFQLNIEAWSLQNAVWMADMIMMLSPYLEAVAGNSFLINGRDTGYNDIRIELWRKMFDVQGNNQIISRVGLPKGYYHNIEQYFETIEQFPFLLPLFEDAVKVGIGMNWATAKIKILGNVMTGEDCSAVVEIRTLPTQPIAEQELGLSFFLLGMLHYARVTKRTLIPFSAVQLNAESATKSGLSGRLWSQFSNRLVDSVKAVQAELDLGIVGLIDLGIYQRVSKYTDLILWRVDPKIGSPTDQLRRALGGSGVYFPEEIIPAMESLQMLK